MIKTRLRTLTWLFMGTLFLSSCGSQEPLSAVELGKKVYKTKACQTCHSVDGTTKTAGTLKGLYGTEVKLNDGSLVIRDETYLRESILNPKAKIPDGSQNVMPAYANRLTDREVEGLIAYIKALGDISDSE